MTFTKGVKTGGKEKPKYIKTKAPEIKAGWTYNQQAFGVVNPLTLEAWVDAK